MAVSQDTLSVVFEVIRAMQNRTKSDLATSRTLTNITDVVLAEPILPASTSNISFDFGSVVTAAALIILTPQPIGVRINGASSRRCGSLLIWLDTDVTSLAFDNTLISPSATIKPSVWLVSTS